MSTLVDIVNDALGENYCRNCENRDCIRKVETYRNAIKKLMLELVGEDEDIVEDYRINGAMPKWERRGANRLRRELRDEINEL